MRRAAVRVTRAEALPEGLASPPEESVVAAASERLDALVAAAFRLSRANVKEKNCKDFVRISPPEM